MASPINLVDRGGMLQRDAPHLGQVVVQRGDHELRFELFGEGRESAQVREQQRRHDALAAESEQIAMVLAGHYASERPAMETLARWLAERFPGLKVWASEREHDPLVECR